MAEISGADALQVISLVTHSITRTPRSILRKQRGIKPLPSSRWDSMPAFALFYRFAEVIKRYL
ncbi:MAG: hypothetical protein II094_07260, partial [Oscillospiraceae bacterium]|nr:hypothetical protein [Oscillospiraceae bacterium]